MGRFTVDLRAGVAAEVPAIHSELNPGDDREIVDALESVITLVTWFDSTPLGSVQGLVLGIHGLEPNSGELAAIPALV